MPNKAARKSNCLAFLLLLFRSVALHASLLPRAPFCRGNSSTAQGAKRHADGHPAPYKVKYFELGNEQCERTLSCFCGVSLCSIMLFVRR